VQSVRCEGRSERSTVTFTPVGGICALVLPGAPSALASGMDGLQHRDNNVQVQIGQCERLRGEACWVGGRRSSSYVGKIVGR